MRRNAGKIDALELLPACVRIFLRQGNNSDKYIPFVYTQIKAVNDDDTFLLIKAKYVDYAKDNLKATKPSRDSQVAVS